ncbi:MAG: response regulator [Desulfobacterales bacterium]|nr:response regulator [Desulfobacterales bacterium]
MSDSNGKQKILIVDDSPENIHILISTLKNNYVIIAAINGERALKLASLEPKPDIILLDIIMPGIDGYEVCKQLKNNDATANIPVIFITAKSDAIDETKGFEYGAIDFIIKPFSPLVVKARIKMHLDLKRYRDHLEEIVKERTSELEQAKISAESANIAKTQFLATITHELLTPMNGIIAASDLALESISEHEIKRHILTIQESASSLHILLNDILDFSNLEANKFKLKINPFKLNDLLYNIAEKFSLRAFENKIEILFDVGKDVPQNIIGDFLRLEKILTNLIDNAIKFNRKGGLVIIGIKAVDKKFGQAQFIFFVKDTGVGIPEKDIKSLFQLFNQLDASSTRKYMGIGMGLKFCKSLLTIMGGEINVKSSEGKGTTFYFKINLKIQEDNDKEIDTFSLKGLNILIIDDCHENITIIKNMLKNFNINIKSAYSGEECLNILKINNSKVLSFDLIIIDWVMSGLDGVETARIIRKEMKITVPIILLTPFGQKPEASISKEIQINYFLNKPILRASIINAIDEIMKSNKEIISDLSENFDNQQLSNLEHIKKIFNDLLESLSLNDPEKINKDFTSLKKYYQNAVVNEIENKIKEYEYDEALEILKELMTND